MDTFNLFDLMAKLGLKSITSQDLRSREEFAGNRDVKKINKLLADNGHELVIFICYPEVNLKSIIAIHNTTLGPATGGTRMWPYGSFYEALNDALILSRAMTYKTAGAGINFGGGKAVIWADPKDKTDALLKAYASEVEKLEGRFCTGEDANISMDDIKIFASVAPRSIIGQPQGLNLGNRQGSGDPAPPTAKGVLRGMKACLDFLKSGDSFHGKTVVIHGIGKVGFGVLELLVKENPSKIVVSDVNKQRIVEGKEKFGVDSVITDKAHKVKCDIYSPCVTLGGILNKKTIPELKCKIVAGSTNNQLSDSIRDSKALAKRNIIYAPDYVINSGGLINVSDELNPSGYSAERVDREVAKIYDRIYQILYLSDKLKYPPLFIANALAESRFIKAKGKMQN